jgi:hypothetical protein
VYVQVNQAINGWEDLPIILSTIVAGCAGADRRRRACHRLFLGGIGNDDPALFAFLFFLFERVHENLITDRSNFSCQIALC